MCLQSCVPRSRFALNTRLSRSGHYVPVSRPTPRWSVICPASSAEFEDAHSFVGENPLHVLRTARDPRVRAGLLRALDTKWSECTAAYEPTEVEQLLAEQLGVGASNVMQLALSNPDLVSIKAADARAAIKALKAANIDVNDIWFLITKRTYLLSIPTTLQRWLDFLTAYGLDARNIQNMLLRAPDGLLASTTLFQAGQVVGFLKQLGIKDEYLAQRVFSVWPEVFGRDVEGQLRPVLTFLMRLGLEVSDICGIVCVWPELLLADVDKQLAPFATYLREVLGCSVVQVAEVILACPHLLGFKADDVFGGRVRSLQALGVTKDELKSMVGRTTRWLTSSGGVQAQVDFLLKHAGFSPEQARTIVVAAPGVLAEKEFELERKWAWAVGVLGASHADVLRCPGAMAVGLMQVLGPRHGFLDKNGKLELLAHPTDAGPRSVRLDLCRLAEPVDDVEWCAGVGVSVLDFRRYRAHWEEEYTQGLTRSAAKEFQDELRKLGIYEGTD